MRIVVTLVGVAIFAVIGCGNDEDCSKDSDCKDDESCVNGSCVSADAGYDAGNAVCGNGDCELTEGCTSCPEDCGRCRQMECGDGECSDSECETCANCPDDCGQCEQTDCGNGICEPGEDIQCSDCASLEDSTCDQSCTSTCDCTQPWTACGVGVRSVCTPVACEDCYDKGLSCCWCPQESCSNVTCAEFGEACPNC